MIRSDLKTRLAGHSDTWIGVALAVLGAAASVMAAGFDANARTYPLALSLVLSGLGVALILRVALSDPKTVSFALPTRVTALSVCVLAPWIVSVSFGLGFVLPTFLMQLAFLQLCGLRPIGKAAAYAAIITAISYLAFIQGLGVRLPRPIAPWLF